MGEEIANSWTALLETLGPLAIFLCGATNSIIGQPPTGVTFTFVGWATTEGTMTIPVVIASWALGYTAGGLAWFQLLAVKGRDWLDRLVIRLGRSPAMFDRAERWFDRWGPWAVFLARLVPGVGWTITIPAGLSGMRWPAFTIATFVGSAIWATFWTFLARAAGEHLQDQIDTLMRYWEPILAGIVGLVVGYVLIQWLRARARRSGQAEDRAEDADQQREQADQHGDADEHEHEDRDDQGQ